MAIQTERRAKLELGKSSEITPSDIDGSNELDRLGIDPDKLIDAGNPVSAPETNSDVFDPDKLIDPKGEADAVSIEEQDVDGKDGSDAKSVSDVDESEIYGSRSRNKAEIGAQDSNGSSLLENFRETGYFTTYKERLAQTPKEGWDGVRGESKCHTEDSQVNAELAKYGVDGIRYKDAQPDFSPVSEGTVTIENMSGKRHGEGGNFEQADEACAKKWNEEKRDGRTDWTSDDVADYREDNHYSWHERSDMKTCDLVPTCVNTGFGHTGGVCECNKRDNVTGGYDNV